MYSFASGPAGSSPGRSSPVWVPSAKATFCVCMVLANNAEPRVELICIVLAPVAGGWHACSDPFPTIFPFLVTWFFRKGPAASHTKRGGFPMKLMRLQAQGPSLARVSSRAPLDRIFFFFKRGTLNYINSDPTNPGSVCTRFQR